MHAAMVQEALARVRQGQPHPPPKTKQQQQQGQGQQQQQKKKQRGAGREFDFSRFSTRHIALQFAYEGDRYLGFSTRVR